MKSSAVLQKQKAFRGSIGIIAAVELFACYKMISIWGALVGSALIVLNLSVLGALYALVPLVREYKEKDLAYDAWQARKVIAPCSRFGKAAAVFSFKCIKAAMLGTFYAAAFVWRSSLNSVRAIYKMKNANTRPAIIR